MTFKCGFNRVLLIGVLGWVGVVPAPVRADASSKKQVDAAYRIYVHGFNLARVQVTYRLLSNAYAVRTAVNADGLLSFLIKMDVISHAEGYFNQNWIAPVSYESSGTSRGAQRHVLLTYHDGVAEVAKLEPPEHDRETIPKAQRGATLDTLSAMAMLLHRMATTGTCNGSAGVFDGLRLTEMRVSGPTRAAVPESFHQVYTGAMLRCDFTGQQVAGFIINSPNRAKMSAVYPGAAWFKVFPDAGMLAARFSFEHPKLGKIIAVLDHFQTSQN